MCLSDRLNFNNLLTSTNKCGLSRLSFLDKSLWTVLFETPKYFATLLTVPLFFKIKSASANILDVIDIFIAILLLCNFYEQIAKNMSFFVKSCHLAYVIQISHVTHSYLHHLARNTHFAPYCLSHTKFFIRLPHASNYFPQSLFTPRHFLSNRLISIYFAHYSHPKTTSNMTQKPPNSKKKEISTSKCKTPKSE